MRIPHRRGLLLSLLLVLVAMAASSGALAQKSHARAVKLPAQYADLSGVRLLYRDSGGAGEPVVFLHAYTGNSLSWVHQIPAFTAAGYRVITYDRRGYGGTVTTAGSQHSTGADDLQALLDYLGIHRFHLVSTGAGGMVALDYAVSFQQRLLSLVVANTMGGIRSPLLAKMGQRIRFPGFSKLPAAFKELSPSYRATHPKGVKRWLAIERSNHPIFQGYKNHVSLKLMNQFHVPTLFIAGESDPYMPPPVMRIMADAVPGAKGVVIPLTSHSAFWEQPAIFNQVVLHFIGEHSSTRQ